METTADARLSKKNKSGSYTNRPYKFQKQLKRNQTRGGCGGSCICFTPKDIQPVYKHGEEWNHTDRKNLSAEAINKFKLKNTIDMACNTCKLKFSAS